VLTEPQEQTSLWAVAVVVPVTWLTLVQAALVVEPMVAALAAARQTALTLALGVLVATASAV
jgi:hypothetical protein